MENMLDKLLGSKKALFILLYLYHYNEIHARAIARGIDASVSAVQNQLKKFEDSGIVVSKKIGTARVYFFNKKSPFTKHLVEMVKITYSTMSIKDKEKLFTLRLRPRRAGKPVIGMKE